jgi:outer membrane lipoprotein-sorting protein
MKKILLNLIVIMTFTACSTINNTVERMKDFSSNNKTVGETFNNTFKKD